jgi:acetyltransferase-like isoleucine patch superfamily enzyme
MIIKQPSYLRFLIKRVSYFVFSAAAIPLFLLERIFSGFRSHDQVFWAFSQFLSLFPGKWGSYLRKGFYGFTMTRCDPDCVIMFGSIFSQRDTEIGRGVYIGPQCNIGMCVIEDDCEIGSGVHILSGRRQHDFRDSAVSIREQGGEFEKIRIGHDTWIGNSAVIMANVGRKCIVGAGSVVTKEVDDFSIVAGNPARLLRKRSMHSEIDAVGKT